MRQKISTILLSVPSVMVIGAVVIYVAMQLALKFVIHIACAPEGYTLADSIMDKTFYLDKGDVTLWFTLVLIVCEIFWIMSQIIELRRILRRNKHDEESVYEREG